MGRGRQQEARGQQQTGAALSFNSLREAALGSTVSRICHCNAPQLAEGSLNYCHRPPRSGSLINSGVGGHLYLDRAVQPTLNIVTELAEQSNPRGRGWRARSPPAGAPLASNTSFTVSLLSFNTSFTVSLPPFLLS